MCEIYLSLADAQLMIFKRSMVLYLVTHAQSNVVLPISLSKKENHSFVSALLKKLKLKHLGETVLYPFTLVCNSI